MIRISSSNGKLVGGHDTHSNRRRWALAIGVLGVAALGTPVQAGTSPSERDCIQPDAWIRVIPNSYIGNDIYNRTAQGQTKLATRASGATVSFGIRIENDDPYSASKFLVRGKPSKDGYAISYLEKGTNVTSAVVAGTYKTPKLSANGGSADVIVATVHVTGAAAAGSELSRIFRITWYSWDATWCQDAVRFTTRRG